MKFELNNFWIKLVLFGALVGLFWIIYSLIPLIGTNLPSPQITIDNATPCLIEGGKYTAVENFEEGVPQYICGDMITDTSPVRLTLIIQPSDNVWTSSYTTSAHLKEGFISFQIDPPLAPGKYRARILWARTTFADIYFDVKEK